MATEQDSFFSLYLQYADNNEAPAIFHRWSAITALAAYLGRNLHFQHGHFSYYPNQYVLLIGSPGAKKSSAIKIASKLIRDAGFNSFAARKTRQEKFLRDLAEAGSTDSDSIDAVLDQNLFGDSAGDMDSSDTIANSMLKPPAECFIAADEFNNFIGQGNLDFASILGELWDFEGVFDYRLQNSKSVYIPHPTINILGGNTPTAFSEAFPPTAIGQGWFSRLLLIYGEKLEYKRVTFPPKPDQNLQRELIALLVRIKAAIVGEIELTPTAEKLVDTVYQSREPIDDVRFDGYENRRLSHLLKGREITEGDVIHANTILTYAENMMPKALGEFGAAKNSKVTHKIMTLLESQARVFPLLEIWRHVHQDLERREQLVEILSNLAAADKIVFQKTDSKHGGYLPIKRRQKTEEDSALDWSLLTDEERLVGGLN